MSGSYQHPYGGASNDQLGNIRATYGAKGSAPVAPTPPPPRVDRGTKPPEFFESFKATSNTTLNYQTGKSSTPGGESGSGRRTPKINRSTKPPEFFQEASKQLAHSTGSMGSRSRSNGPPRPDRGTKPKEFFDNVAAQKFPPMQHQTASAPVLSVTQSTSDSHKNTTPKSSPSPYELTPYQPSTLNHTSDGEESSGGEEGSDDSEDDMPTSAEAIAAEIKSFAADANMFQMFLKSLDTRVVCEEDSVLLSETISALQIIGTHLEAVLQNALLVGSMDDDTLFALKGTFDRVWSMVQALIKLARKKERRRHTISTNPEHAAAIAREQGHIREAEAFKKEQEAVAFGAEQDEHALQMQALELKERSKEQRWSTMHPLLAGGKHYEYTDDVLIQERNREMQAIAEEAQELDQMMEQVEVQVQEQGEQLDEAAVHVDQAHQNVDEGVKTIIATSRKKKYYIVAGGTAVAGAAVGVGVGSVLGPAGMVVGGALGAAVGGAAGIGGAMAMQKKRDMDAFKVHLDNKWVRDKDVKACQGCGKKFTQTRRRHHCRSCGKIFCNRCSRKRVKLPKVQFYKKVRVCEPCFIEAIHTTTDAAGNIIEPKDNKPDAAETEAHVMGSIPEPSDEVFQAAQASGQNNNNYYYSSYAQQPAQQPAGGPPAPYGSSEYESQRYSTSIL